MQGSSKNLFHEETNAPQDSARNSALAHFRSNTSFFKRYGEVEQGQNQ